MYLDIAAGLIIGFLVAVMTDGIHAAPLLFGVFAALAPDIDFIVWLIRHRWKVDQFAHEHRDLLHKPLLFSFGGGLVLAFFDPSFGLIWFLGTMAHFIHDTLDGGWGIRWLHPFSGGYYTLAPYSPKRYFKDLAEQRAIAAVHGDPQWLEKQYLKLNPKLLFEYAILGSVLLGVFFWLVRSKGIV